MRAEPKADAKVVIGNCATQPVQNNGKATALELLAVWQHTILGIACERYACPLR